MRKTRKQSFDNVDLLAAKKISTNTQEVPSEQILNSVLERKRITRQRKREKRRRLLIRLLGLLVILGAIFLFLRSHYFAIKDIKVEGMSYFTGSEVISMSGAEPGRNLIFNAGASEIEENLSSNPYFKSVKVKRKLPSTLIIQVEERPQIAAIVFGGSYVVIDDVGVVLRKTDVDPKLTLLTGLTISKMSIGEAVDAEEKEFLAITLRMLNTMRDGDMYFKKIDVSKVVIRAYIYDNLLVKGTPGEIMSAIESGELQKVVSNLFDQNISRGTIVMGGSSYISFSPELDAD